MPGLIACLGRARSTCETPRDVETVRRVLRESGLLALIATLTWVSTQDPALGDWIPDGFDGAYLWTWLPVGCAVLFTALRLRWPTVAVLASAMQFGWWPSSGTALAVTAFEIARFPSARRRITVLAVASAAGLGLSFLSGQAPERVGFQFAMLLVCLALPTLAQTLLGKAARVQRALRERALYLEENNLLVRSSAQLAERSRIAQEMHDQLGHRLSLIAMYAGALEQGPGGAAGTHTAELTLIRGTAQTAMHELRAILGVLRSGGHGAGSSQPLQEAGLRSDIARLVAQSQAAGVAVELRWRGADLGDAPSPVRSAVHNVVREGLTNVHRHAGGAAATILVERGPDAVHVRVSNVAVRRSAARVRSLPGGSGLGLVGLRERVAVLGGTFSADRLPSGGFELTADLPMREPSVSGHFTEPGEPAIDPAGEPGTSEPPPAALHAAGKQALPVDRWVRHGSSGVVVGGLVGVTALVLQVLAYSPARTTTDLDLHIGMTRAQVLEVVNVDDPFARSAARLVESRPPDRSTCLYEQDWDGINQAAVRRYCFRDDRLISKDRFAIGTGG